MTAILFPVCTAFTRHEEGGWANNSSDPGGYTMEGITLHTYQSWCAEEHAPAPGPTELHAITDDEWNAIAGAWYWNPVHGDALPPGVDLMAFDFGFNAGTRISARVLQKAVGVTADGWIGPQTLAAIGAHPTPAMIVSIAMGQEGYYRSLANFPAFGKEWLARNVRRRDAALSMLNGHALPVPAPIVSAADALNDAQVAKDHTP